ncbi:MAG TPA: CHAP domain-containing protein, partial [Candidatus Saccharimonadales bacterium]|nr:CHAP domain-containing protein [Candidatus Saccharimonadales bacterium]
DIQTTENQLTDLTNKLNTAYANLYELSQTSTVELIIQNKSIDDILNQTQYIQSLQTNLQQNIAQEKSLKADLQDKKQVSEAQKASLQAQQNQLTSEKATLTNQQNQKTYLLSQTMGQEAQYQSLIQNLRNQDFAANQQLADLLNQLSGCFGETISGGTGGYPWASSPGQVDPWGFYTGQCTSFAAFRFSGVFGRPFNDTRPGNGSAWNWPALAGDQGYRTSSMPRVGSVVSWPRNSFMPYGHVAWVTAVNGNGTINVEEYNWAHPNAYDQRFNVSPNNYGSPTYIYP